MGNGVFEIEFAKGLINCLIDIIYPKKNLCLFCRKELNIIKEYTLCPDCMKILPLLPDNTCIRCGRVLNYFDSHMSICSECRDSNSYFNRAASVCEFSGVAKELLHNLKYNGEKDIAFFFGHLMAGMLRKLHWDVDIILPVPLHNERFLERGFNQSQLLAAEIGRECAIDVSDKILFRNRPTKSQVTLQRLERRENVKGAFDVLNPKVIEGKSVLVVDDIMTTGSTLNECSRILKNNGVTKIYCLTAACPINLNNY